jgi:hypothetical protein
VTTSTEHPELLEASPICQGHTRVRARALTEQQQALYDYLRVTGYIPDDVAADRDPFDALEASVDVLTEWAHDGDGSPGMLALARACDIAIYGPTELLARRWLAGDLEGRAVDRLFDRVRVDWEVARSAGEDPAMKLRALVKDPQGAWVYSLIEAAMAKVTCWAVVDFDNPRSGIVQSTWPCVELAQGGAEKAILEAQRGSEASEPGCSSLEVLTIGIFTKVGDRVHR